MGRANRKMGAGATLREAESHALHGLQFESLQLRDGVVEKDVYGSDPFLLHDKIDKIEREDWGDSTALLYQYSGELGAVFFSQGEPRYAASPGSRTVRSLDDGTTLGTISSPPSLEEISQEAARSAEEELASRGGDPRGKLVLQSKYIGRTLAENFQHQKRELLRVMRRAL